MRVGEATIFHGGHGVVLKSEEDGMEEEDEVGKGCVSHASGGGHPHLVGYYFLNSTPPDGVSVDVTM